MSDSAKTLVASSAGDRRSDLVTEVHRFLEYEIPRSSVEKVVVALEQLGSGEVDPARPTALQSELIATLMEVSINFGRANDPSSDGQFRPGEKFWTDLIRWLETKDYRVVKTRL